jgi:hypothetical protein
MPERSDFYDARYRTVPDDVRTAVRREVFGEDIGQASWLTVDEYRAFFGLVGPPRRPACARRRLRLR